MSCNIYVVVRLENGTKVKKKSEYSKKKQTLRHVTYLNVTKRKVEFTKRGIKNYFSATV
jgi:hypothetical protein